MSFFHVLLVCEAAPGLGCGTIARPVLADIEARPGIREAWLSREGTVLGIVWADGAPNPERVLSILQAHGICGVELRDAEHMQSNDSLAAGGWYGLIQMQELSAEEARVIAVRLVGRLEKKATLPPGTAQRLAARLEHACAEVLAGASATSAEARRGQIAAALLEAGRNVLATEAFQSFADIVSLGHRPLPGER